MTVSTACGRWPEELRFPPPVMKSKPFLRVQGATVSTRAARSSRPGSTSLGRGGSWLSRPASEASGSCRNQGVGVWGIVVGSGYRMRGGFDTAVRWRSRAGSTGFGKRCSRAGSTGFGKRCSRAGSTGLNLPETGCDLRRLGSSTRCPACPRGRSCRDSGCGPGRRPRTASAG